VKRLAVVGAVVLALGWVWLEAFAWFDPFALCRIHIDVDLLEGDRAAIEAAIAVVRREDPGAYRALCAWVDRIQEERACAAGDPQADRGFRGAAVPVEALEPALRRAREAPGCYVRGSRIVVLRRARDGEDPITLLRQRADALKRLARYSEASWASTLR
jgi:hypothetical protein